MAKRTFFSFHYEDVKDFRVNVVRNSNFTKDRAHFIDASLWEDAQRKGRESLKKLIVDGLENTSATAVLIGTQTFSRPWVRFEIIESLKKGNKLVGVHLNSIKCREQKTLDHGPNPFLYLALQFNSSGTFVEPREWNGQSWVSNADMPGWSVNKMPQESSKLVQLTQWTNCYCWVQHDGYNNFENWIS